MKKKQRGFTIVELVAVIAVLSALLLIIGRQIVKYHEYITAIRYAEYTHEVSIRYKNYIINHYAEIYKNLLTTHYVVLPYNRLLQEGFSYLSEYGSPCTVIEFNDVTKKMLMYMFYMHSPNTKQQDKHILNIAKNHIGVLAGLYHAGAVIGYKNSWQIINNDPILQATSVCSSSSIVDQSLVLNISNLVDFLNFDEMIDDSLHRHKDTTHSLDDTDNSNLMLTDLYLGNGITNNALVLDPATNLAIVSANSDYIRKDNRYNRIIDTNSNITAVITGDVVANSIQPLSLQSEGAMCKPIEVGKISVEFSAGQRPRSIVTCTYDTVICRILNPQNLSGYCYISIEDYTVIHHPQNNYRGTYICPEDTFIDDSIAVDYDEFGYDENKVKCHIWGDCSYRGAVHKKISLEFPLGNNLYKAVHAIVWRDRKCDGCVGGGGNATRPADQDARLLSFGCTNRLKHYDIFQ